MCAKATGVGMKYKHLDEGCALPKLVWINGVIEAFMDETKMFNFQIEYLLINGPYFDIYAMRFLKCVKIERKHYPMHMQDLNKYWQTMNA